MMKIYRYGEVSNDEIFARPDMKTGVEDVVADIISNVRARGDEALFEYCRKFDKAELTTLEVSEAEIDEAFDVIGDFRRVLERAAANITKFHEKQLRNSFIINDEDGIVMGQKVIPMDKAGLYVPGGTAAYPSTVLMDAVPAKIAGVGELVITTPPGPDGKVNPYVLAAAKVAGVDRILKVGGAQAIAALAYGTETVPKVDKIVGPGNAFVAEAKKQVFGIVSIDMIAGPSEVLCVADAKSDPRHVAADLLAQAEHDKNASAVLVTDSMELAEQVAAEVDRQLKTLPRTEIATASIESTSRTRSRPSTSSSTWTTPLITLTPSGMPAPSSWAATVRNPSATTSPARTTRCRPSAPRSSRARCPSTTSSRKLSTPITRETRSPVSMKTSQTLRTMKACTVMPGASAPALKTIRNKEGFDEQVFRFQIRRP